MKLFIECQQYSPYVLSLDPVYFPPLFPEYWFLLYPSMNSKWTCYARIDIILYQSLKCDFLEILKSERLIEVTIDLASNQKCLLLSNCQHFLCESVKSRWLWIKASFNIFTTPILVIELYHSGGNRITR